MKNALKFNGGVHPTNGSDKALTSNKKIVNYVPQYVHINMKQGLGPKCNCIVKVNEHVDQGQLIGEATHFLSANIYSSVSGIVEEVNEDVCTIKVENFSQVDSSLPFMNGIVDVSEFSKEKIIENLENGGVVGMGGAGFPTSVKYKTTDEITHVLINAAECEPFLTCDEHLMLERCYAIINGIQLLLKASNASQAIICMEDNKVNCKEHLESLLNDQVNISIQLLPTMYPQGGEKQLIQAVLGKEIPSGGLPSNVGVIVSNVATAYATAIMSFTATPLISRVITITGDVHEPQNYEVPLGTSIGELVKESKDVISETNRIILGGPMTGTCIANNATAQSLSENHLLTVTKVSGGLVVLGDLELEESDCIRCGGCVHACPAGLNPFKIDFAIRKDNVDLCQQLHATECIACGCCSYVCPAKRELTHHTVKARDLVKAKLREEANKNA